MLGKKTVEVHACVQLKKKNAKGKKKVGFLTCVT